MLPEPKFCTWIVVGKSVHEFQFDNWFGRPESAVNAEFIWIIGCVNISSFTLLVPRTLLNPFIVDAGMLIFPIVIVSENDLFGAENGTVWPYTFVAIPFES